MNVRTLAVIKPAPKDLTVQELTKWADALDGETVNNIGIDPWNKTLKGSVRLKFKVLDPATAKKLVEYYLHLQAER
jgi:hypothetical protein